MFIMDHVYKKIYIIKRSKDYNGVSVFHWNRSSACICCFLAYRHIGFLSLSINIYFAFYFFATIYKILCNVIQIRTKDMYQAQYTFLMTLISITHEYAIFHSMVTLHITLLRVRLQRRLSSFWASIFNHALQRIQCILRNSIHLHIFDKYMQIVSVLSFRKLVFRRLFHLIA